MLVAMELVEGATLADRISPGPIPLDEAPGTHESFTRAPYCFFLNSSLYGG